MRQDLEPIRRPGAPGPGPGGTRRAGRLLLPGDVGLGPGRPAPAGRSGAGASLGPAAAASRRRRRRRGNDAGSDAGDDAEARAWPEALDQGHALLARYLEWTPRADRFAPVLVETDFEVNVLDPATPDAALVAGRGEPVRYTGRIDMMAVDEHDAYWIVRHRVVDARLAVHRAAGRRRGESSPRAGPGSSSISGWPSPERSSTSCGSRRPGIAPPGGERQPGHQQGRQQRRQRGSWRKGWPWRPARSPAAPAVRQHEPSGGGRSIPQHRRMYAQAREPRRVEPIEQLDEDGFRRTWLRRRPADVAEAGRRLGADVAEMIRARLEPSIPNPPTTSARPAPSSTRARPCERATTPNPSCARATARGRPYPQKKAASAAAPGASAAAPPRPDSAPAATPDSSS